MLRFAGLRCKCVPITKATGGAKQAICCKTYATDADNPGELRSIAGTEDSDTLAPAPRC